MVEDLSLKELCSKADQIDRIVLIDPEHAFAVGFNYPLLIGSYELFKSLGARGLVLNYSVPNQVVGDWLDVDNGKAEIQRLPIAEIGMEDYKLRFGDADSPRNPHGSLWRKGV